MGIYTKLSEEKYQELEKQYIKHCEAPEEKDYELFLDSVSAATIGIGFNVYNNPEWITILLLCKFGDLKPLEQLDTYYSNPIYYGSGNYDKFLKKYSRTIISKEESRQKITVRSVNKILQLILAHKNKYNVTAGKKFPKMEELNQQVQNLIDEYNKEDGVEKIPVSNFSFSLSSEEAEAIYHAGKLKYLNIIDKYLAGSGKIFNAEQIKNTNLFISLLSLSYQQGSLKLLNNIFYSGIEKSRFLIWFALRYKMAVLSDKSLRRLHDSVIFGLLEPRKDDAAQADIPAVINDIFAYLNYPQNKDSYTSYLDYMKNLPENNIDEIAKDDNTVCFHKGNEYKIIFDSLLKTDSIENYFIDTSFLENKFLDNIIDFAPYDTIFSIFTQLIKESFGEELKSKKGSEELFLLENIYVVECINKEKFISLMELKYSSLQEKCNVFLFLNSTLDIVNDISYLQSKCPNVHFTIGIQAGYTYSFRLDDKSSAQTNIMLYSIKDGKYIPELLKDTFKAENISSEESQNEKNILLFSAEENNNLSGRLSNNANIFHITHQSEEKIISKIKLYNLISDKYEGNIQVDMQDKEYEVSAAKSSGEFNVDITLSILDEALNDEEINDKPYYMLVNSTGEIFESKVSNGKASFSYNPAEARSNQKVLFSFNKADLLCKKSANGKCLDFIHINKTYMENKQVERTFTINKEDVVTPIKFTSLPDKETIEGNAFLDGLEDDDIIRIEAEDGSEEYIEIIFPKDNKDWKDTAIDIITGALDIVSNLPHPLLKSGKFVSKGVKFAAKEIRTVKQLTKAQKKILDIVDKLPSPKKRSKSGKINDGENIRLVKTENDLKNLWKDLAEDIDITQKKIEGKGDIFQGRVDENMIIQYRTFSSKISQNKPTIDINGGTKSTSRKVHIDVSKDNIGGK